MGGFFNTLGTGLEDYAKQRLGIGQNQNQNPAQQKKPRLLGAMGNAITRYRQAHQSAPGSPMNHMDQSPVPQANGGPSDPASLVADQTPIDQGNDDGENDSLTPPQSYSPPQADNQSAADDAEELGSLAMLARGKIVTKPTVAILGESGPEKVVPLNANPENRVLPGPLGIKAHTRYRHLTGPNAPGRNSPAKDLLPLRPNVPMR